MRRRSIRQHDVVASRPNLRDASILSHPYGGNIGAAEFLFGRLPSRCHGTTPHPAYDRQGQHSAPLDTFGKRVCYG